MHQSYTIDHIVEIIDGKLSGKSQPKLIIKNLLTNSRQLIIADDTIFFALITSRNDGHKYISELYEKGVRVFVISHTPDNFESMSEATFISVPNTLSALQKLAAWHRQQFNIPVIGITGSNGKTIVKEWLYQILSEDKSVIRSPKSYNSQIGVPLSVWQMDNQHEVAIFEAGISEPDEMERLQAIIKPTIGIFTNIGQAHSENFIKNDQKIGEKLKLFTKVSHLIYCLDHSDIQNIIRRSGILERTQSFTWSKNAEIANLYIKSINKEAKSTSIVGIHQGKETSIEIPFTDNASIENAIHCWAAALLLGLSDEVIAERMKKISPIAMRMELKAGINNCTIINDSYNSDINSLAIALDFMNQQQQHKQNTLILSDIMQSGQNEVELYNSVAELIYSKGIDTLIGIGEAITRQAKAFGKIKCHFFADCKTFLLSYPLSSFNNQTILLKGARVFEFEQISKELQEKAHETVLEVNLNNLIFNMNYYRSKIKPETKLMVMVKAFGYGSGNFEVSNVLQFHHADYLTVAFADEGVELRKAGIKLPIMVMSPEENSFETIIRYNLEPEVYSFRELSLLENCIKHMAIETPINIHIKVDSGMHRLGFSEEEFPELIDKLKSNNMLYVRSIFSHLAASDNPEQDAFTLSQIDMFDRVSSLVQQAFDHKIIRHILNTSGITRFTKFQFDMVRLGIGIYGVPSNSEDINSLKTVLTLKSSITQIKELNPDQTVGYNRHGILNRKSRIGTVPIGYADGLSRQLGNRNGILWVNDQACPIVGDICMDMCMIDLTGIKAEEGDTVIIFNEQHKVTDISKVCNTIPYEILTRISRRVKRIYFQE